MQGWGAMGGGAWGKAPEPPADPDSPPAPPPPPSASSNAFSKFSFTKRQDSYPDGPPPSLPPQQSAFGAYGTMPADTAGSSAFQPQGNKEAELRKKEAELADKEKRLKQMEDDLVASGATIKKKNWPICFPMLYHNIADDIPEKSRRVVRELYMCWWGLVLCLSVNLFAACVMLGYKVDDKVSSWFLAVTYWILGVPAGFFLWYRKIYNAGKSDSTLSFVGYFFWFLIHCAFCIWAAIAFPFEKERWSFAGWITAMVAFDKSSFAGIVYIIGASLWTGEAVWCLWCLKDSYLFFRGSGGVQQAKQDAALAVFKSQMTHNAV